LTGVALSVILKQTNVSKEYAVGSPKERIFNCSACLFSEKGYDGFSIRDIVKAAGIKENSIYNHYNGKRTPTEEIGRRFVATLKTQRPPLDEVEARLERMRCSRP
jgi:AcrR family transcriptional regulator